MYAVCVWLLKLGDQTSLLVGAIIGTVALLTGVAQWARWRAHAG